MPKTLAPDIKVIATKRQRLEQLETIIKDSYYRQGEAFKEIRDARLYLLDYESFDAYCKSQWNHNRAWADRLISAAQVAGNIKQIDPNGSIPRNESQARALTKLNPEAQRAVLAEAENMTAREIEKVARKYKLDTNGTQTESINQVETSREHLAWFQEKCMEVAFLKKTNDYVKDWLDELWIQVNNLPESLEVSGIKFQLKEVSKIKFQLKMIFYENEWMAYQIDLAEMRLANNPWGFAVD